MHTYLIPPFCPAFYSSIAPAKDALDQMLAPEVRPQVHDLPHSQPHKTPHSANCEPLDTLVRALVGISEFHLTAPQEVQLVNDLSGQARHALELNFDRLQLLGGLDRRPVLGICADIDVELHGFGRAQDAVGGCKDVLEADVEGAIGVGCESVSCFAGNIARACVVIADCILDLEKGNVLAAYASHMF